MSKRKQSILFLSHVADSSGGAEKSLIELAKDTIANNHNVIVIVPGEGTVATTIQELGGIAEVIPFSWWAYLNDNKITANHALPIAQIIELIKKYRPDYCVTNSIVSPCLAYAAAIMRVRHIWVLREFGAIDHGLHFSLSEDDIYTTVDNFADKILVNSKATQSYYSQKLPKNSNSIDIIYPFVAPGEPDIDFTSPFKQDYFKLVIVGQIKPSKGQSDPIKAVNTLKQQGFKVQLCVVGSVGDEDYTQELRTFITENNLEDDVIFAGYQKNPFNYLAVADTAIVASANEAFGRVTVEAMLSKTPVIGARGQGTSLLIKDKTTGLLYEPGNHNELVAKISDLINDADLRKSLIANAKKYADDNFSRDKSHKAFFDAISSDAPKTTTPNLFVFNKLGDIYKEIQSLNERALSLTNNLEVNRQMLETITSSKSWKIITKYRVLRDWVKGNSRKK